MEIRCGDFTFFSNFDSGNLSRVELVSKGEPEDSVQGEVSEKGPSYEYNVWTRPDCAGTRFETSHRTWFHFGMRGGPPLSTVKFNIVNMNDKTRLFVQGMQPVYKVVPEMLCWQRIPGKVKFTMENKNLALSFKIQTPENKVSRTYMAFTYPYPYSELQSMLKCVDKYCEQFGILYNENKNLDNIYYHRECVIHSLDKLRIDLLTISSHHGITGEREDRLKKLFPDKKVQRPFKFQNKKVVFISARVHAAETPSSFVFEGFLNFILNAEEPIALLLRKRYVFKLIPTLNPDGIVRGHYRTDARGVDLNTVYRNPSPKYHPSVYAARALIHYYHFAEELDDVIKLDYDYPENVQSELD